MTLMYLWIYTLILVIIWWFFIVARIHAYKFKNFSENIEKITKILLVLLIFFSVLWYIVLIFSSSSSDWVDFWGSDYDFNEVNY